MRYYFLLVKIITVPLIFKATYSHESIVKGKENIDIFNVLLGLFKLNPLKTSKVYKTFSENKLTQGEKLKVFTHLDSNNKQYPHVEESTDSEKIMHPLTKWWYDTNHIEKPEYDIENIDTEDFNVNLVLQDHFTDKLKEYFNNAPKNELKFSNIFGYLGSLEFYTDVPRTTLLPTASVSFLTENKTKYKLIPSVNKHKKYEKEKGKPFVGLSDPMRGLDNNIEEGPIMSNNLMIGDVIVF